MSNIKHARLIIAFEQSEVMCSSFTLHSERGFGDTFLRGHIILLVWYLPRTTIAPTLFTWCFPQWV